MRPCACLVAALALGCTPPPPPPAPPPIVVAPIPTVAPEPPPPIGPPVLVPQRLGRGSRDVDLSPSGKLIVTTGSGGLHVIDVDTGQTRGVLPGCSDRYVFTGDGRSVVSVCRATKTARAWDLATDTARSIKLDRAPRRLSRPSWGTRVIAPGDGRIDVIDARTGSTFTLETGKHREITNIEAVPSGWIAATDREAVSLWSPAGKLAHRVPKASDATAYSLASSGKRLALADARGLSIVDTHSGKESGRIAPCGESSIDDVEWTADEEYLAVACASRNARSPARAILVTPEGAEIHTLQESERGHFIVIPRDDRVAVIERSKGVGVFDVVSGRELFRLAQPATTSERPLLSRDLSRALFRRGRYIETVTVVDRARGAVGPRLTTMQAPLAIGRAGELIYFRDAGQTVYLDPIKNQVTRGLPSDVSPDGAIHVAPALGGDGGGGELDIVDRRSGERRRMRGSRGTASSALFSDHGAWVMLEDGAAPKKKVPAPPSVRLHDAKTGKPGKSFPWSPLSLVAWSPDDMRFAMRVETHKARDGRACTNLMDGLCGVVRVFDARSGRAMATIRPEGSGLTPYEITPDGKHMAIGDRVYDLRSGRGVWSIPYGASLAHVPGKGLLMRVTGGPWRLVNEANGKTIRDLPSIGSKVGAITRNGAFLLTVSGMHASLCETATWTCKPSTLAVARDQIVILSEDGKLVYTVADGDLLTYRFSDHRSIRRTLPRLDFEITDEGVFDPASAASGVMLARRGPDVARSPMAPITVMSDRFGHHGLYADFVAGEPVSPKAASEAAPTP